MPLHRCRQEISCLLCQLNGGPMTRYGPLNNCCLTTHIGTHYATRSSKLTNAKHTRFPFGLERNPLECMLPRYTTKGGFRQRTSQCRYRLSRFGISIIKIRRPWNPPIFIMGLLYWWEDIMLLRRPSKCQVVMLLFRQAPSSCIWLICTFMRLNGRLDEIQ